MSLSLPVLVLGRDNKTYQGTASMVDLDRETVFCSLNVLGGCCSGWFDVSRVTLVDDE